MHCLITGTAGFIGFHLARRLLEEGHSVAGLDAMTDYYDVNLKHQRHAILEQYAQFTPLIGRLEDGVTLRRAAQLGAPDVILHLAAQAGVRYSLENPGAYIQSNLLGSWHLLEFARAHHPRHLLLASTSSVYGACEEIPFVENGTTDQPLTLYAATKKSMEVMAHSYSHLYKIPTTAFRFFTVYGPWGRPDMALFRFVDAIQAGRPIDVYGYGRLSRDFTYIDDLIEGICLLLGLPPNESDRLPDDALDTLSPQAPYRVVNIGGGTPVELLRFIEIIESIVGKTAQRNYLPPQPGDVPRTFADPEQLRALTGFVPATPVEEGVRRFFDWYREQYSSASATPDSEKKSDTAPAEAVNAGH